VHSGTRQILGTLVLSLVLPVRSLLIIIDATFRTATYEIFQRSAIDLSIFIVLFVINYYGASKMVIRKPQSVTMKKSRALLGFSVKKVFFLYWFNIMVNVAILKLFCLNKLAEVFRQNCSWIHNSKIRYNQAIISSYFSLDIHYTCLINCSSSYLVSNVNFMPKFEIEPYQHCSFGRLLFWEIRNCNLFDRNCFRLIFPKRLKLLKMFYIFTLKKSISYS
jgi:hypothetical protein